MHLSQLTDDNLHCHAATVTMLTHNSQQTAVQVFWLCMLWFACWYQLFQPHLLP